MKWYDRDMDGQEVAMPDVDSKSYQPEAQPQIEQLKKPTSESVSKELQRRFFEGEGKELRLGEPMQRLFDDERRFRQQTQQFLDAGILKIEKKEDKLKYIKLGGGAYIKTEDGYRKQAPGEIDAWTDSQLVEEAIKGTEQWRIRNETMNIRLTARDVQKVREFDQKLLDDKDLAKALIGGVLDFHQERMSISDVETQDNYLEAKHAIQVAGLILGENITTNKRLMELIDRETRKGKLTTAFFAIGHDLIKHDKKLFALTGHEPYSEEAGSETDAAASEAVGADSETVEAVRKLARIAYACHGEGEYPEIQASRSIVYKDVKTTPEGKDEWLTAGLVSFGGDNNQTIELHLRALRSEKVRLFQSRENVSREDENFARGIIMDLSLADKASGMDKLAPAKYIKPMLVLTVFGENSQSGQFVVKNFSNSFVRNYDACPETAEKHGPLMQEIWQRGGLLYTLLDQVDKEQLIDNGGSEEAPVPDKWQALGEFGEEAYLIARDMKAVFQAGVGTYKALEPIMNRQIKKNVMEMMAVDGRRGAMETTAVKGNLVQGLESFKQSYAVLYEQLAGAIDKIPMERLPQAGNGGLGDEVQGVLDDLVQLWRIPTGKL